MTYRCVVIDDEKPARERVKRLLAAHPDFELVGEAASGDEAVRLIDAVEPDLCLLDVQMPAGDGFDVLRRVRKLPGVIFTTAYDQYAVRAFEVHSLDYLLKPFDRRRFGDALNRARAALEQRAGSAERILGLLGEILGRVQPAAPADSEPVRIPARRAAKIVLLSPAEVLWFEAEETLVFARTPEGRFLVERTLAELETVLAADFFRAHRGYLVNLAQIAEILPGDAGTYRMVLRDSAKSVLPLSRRQAKKLRERIPW
ncbi:MAG TPA: LytTR family DNA-binding domain-containing protein [Candidatus Polarisedimenticolaceae bacterium]|nr:LytTR family DNA-binding domain-containing protein [Candidatus Polarisedimenticolaceae bacterium]